MKKVILAFMLLLVMMIMLIPAAMAEALTPITEELPFDPSGPTQLLDETVLLTFFGMVAVTLLLSQGIKLLIMKNASGDTIRTMVFFVALVVVLLSKLISAEPFKVSDILLIPGNAVGVWFSGLKVYEKFFGSPETPAGTIKT